MYSPYLNTLGGGERYLLTFAEYCLQKGWETELWWDNEVIVKQAMERFHLQLEELKTNSLMYQSIQADASYSRGVYKWWQMRQYDLVFWLSDGSIPYLHGKQNWLHFQVPFQIEGSSFWTQQKLTHVHKVVCNSNFTKQFIDKSFNLQADILYPPVDIESFKLEQEKEHIILNVGRFDQIMNAKRQDVLIKAFKKLVDEGLDNWQLVLAGGLEHEESALLELREMSMGYPIEFCINVSFEELHLWYQRANIYWHATGFEVDEQKNPEKVEHFGISVVEAMASGCVPIIYPAGGIKEIISDKKNGYYWEDEEQLVRMTKQVIEDYPKTFELREEAQKDADQFSKESFFRNLDGMLLK